MKGIRKFTEHDFFVRDVEVIEDFCLTFSFKGLDADDFFRLNTRLTGKLAKIEGIYDLHDDSVSLRCDICDKDDNFEQSFDFDISGEEEVLCQKKVTQWLWEVHGFLPKDYYRYEVSNRDNNVSRGDHDAYWEEIKRLDRKLQQMVNPAPLTERQVPDTESAGKGKAAEPAREVKAVRIDSEKEKCRKLRMIRKLIAEVNDIPFEPAECHHQGPCSGSCTVCNAEIIYLNSKLEERRRKGKKVLLSGLSGEGHALS